MLRAVGDKVGWGMSTEKEIAKPELKNAPLKGVEIRVVTNGYIARFPEYDLRPSDKNNPFYVFRTIDELTGWLKVGLAEPQDV